MSAQRHGPRTEAQALLSGDLVATVLEPSPPAVQDDDWFADDPLAAAGGPDVVVPFASGAHTWNALAADDAAVAVHAAEHWLGAWRTLGPLPANYVATRNALHRVAVYVVSPARRQVNTKIGLRYTTGGFGTPYFGADRQVRVEGAELVIEDPAGTTRTPITTLRAAAAPALGAEPDIAWSEGFDVPAAGDLDGDLSIDAASAAALGDWYGFGTSVLEELRHGASPEEDPGRIQLWPEHFDPAVEIGTEASKRRAAFGASPGDEGNADPYLYVGPWFGDEVPDDPYWNAEHYTGALMPYADILAADDQRAAALAFYRKGLDLLRLV